MKRMTFSFGRLNPPTIGHGKLLDALKKVAKGEYRLYMSKSHDKKKNPLSFKDKIKYTRMMFPKHSLYIMDDNVVNVFDILVKLQDEGYEAVTMVVGSDRISEFKSLINKYNGKEARHGFYDFKDIKVESAGDRDPDAEGVEGMSASKMRKAVTDNDFESFEKGLPSGFKKGQKLFDILKDEMGIKSFNEWVLMSEAFNVPIKTEKDIDDLETKLDKPMLKMLLSYLTSLGIDEVPIVAGSNSSNDKNRIKIRTKGDNEQQEIRSWMSDNIPDIKPLFGRGSIGTGGAVKVSENTQELMVAALVLGKVISKNIDEISAIKIIEDSKKHFDKIVGASARKDLVDQFTGNFNDLATAISSSNAILKIVPNPVKVYWTGKGWHSDISIFNPKIGNVKDYNSSDIVVKGDDGIFYGFSLKKKGRSQDVDPTLINKPITGKVGILKDILGDKSVTKINRAKELFFNHVIIAHYGDKAFKDAKNDKEKGVLIRGISQKQMGVYLKDPKNLFFRRVNLELTKHPEDFVKSFINLLFRTEMKDIEDAGKFKFYLLTGIGRFIKGNVEVESAEVHDTPDTIEVITKIFDSSLDMKKTSGKLNAWEKKSNAAKIFFTITSDNKPIINLEIRYKGSYTANPQFQAVATADFKAFFK